MTRFAQPDIWVKALLSCSLISMLILTGCASTQSPSVSPSETATSLYEASLNKSVTIHGTAANAMIGAVLMTDDDTPIYLDGVEEWDSKIIGKRVVVSGTLRLRKIAPTPVVGPKGERSSGIEGDSYVLEDPTWKSP